ncbi:2-phospho-L-lactate guanylyltransferase [Halalkalicoccus jeotgali]|uniref:2-phospho-L-lactate guanylyltransferase n=1 Tax=Halalkalicoccus jeotgali (strain DSM 18796 / CECT 7217 / JCM 14584 / KCTC 4019 / B3) TaxID=795797 RepID=D8J9G7_HALJB|nr:2-phospho-L-lactate guanylyltransferase [Halalkalicoccus jeotgali]ADJ14379.1 phospholactate guanylyltransferase [Halalkalicoccus jeotgali B3]ELY40640.1 phospholactate guanylyltransferase [Halalkalicoccus jeotgali B3]
MRVVVPFATVDPKTRLSGPLDPEERREFSRAMLGDVLESVREAGGEPEVLATAPLDVDTPATVDDRPLTEAVNAALEPETAVVMADLPLLTAETIEGLFETPGDVVLAPGRGGGTNALLSREPEFRVDYHGGSFLKHRASASEIGSVGVVDSHRLATDIDEPADLVEVLIHGEGRAVQWLREAGFSLVRTESRLAVDRAPDGR